jgi:hypothetical protein
MLITQQAPQVAQAQGETAVLGSLPMPTLYVGAGIGQAANVVEVHDKNTALQFSIGPTGAIQIAGGTGGTVGFFGTTPALQQTAAGNTHTVAAGSTTTVFVNTTFDGGVGSTAYTVGDLVKCLKAYGIIAN